jgi:hypothetical protein
MQKITSSSSSPLTVNANEVDLTIPDVSKNTVVYFVNGQQRTYVPGSTEESRLVRKVDLHMFTCICLLFLLNYLDRTNVRLIGASIPSIHLQLLCFRLEMRRSVECSTTCACHRRIILLHCRRHNLSSNFSPPVAEFSY